MLDRFYRADQVVSKRLADVLGPKLTSRQYFILRCIYEHNYALSLGDIADLTRIGRASVVSTCRRLVERDWIEVDGNQFERRRPLARLTADGVATTQDSIGKAEQLERELEARIGADDWRFMTLVVDRLIVLDE